MKSDGSWRNKLDALPSWEDERSETLLGIKALYREFVSLATEIDRKPI